jgi:pyruvate/2-oxoglutarate/acetoin dehydrogenase E1 component/TPP-dependent pyruvate/acetoin dehydrogenase alpha subunit
LITNTLSQQNDSLTREVSLKVFQLACESRQASLMGRKEVFMGKAKFGIFGDGKEIAQIAMAKAFREGDWRSGYYRDQTFMFAIGELTLQQYFAQLYAHADIEADPATAGRMMNGHFSTRSLQTDGTWKDLTKIKNSSADISPTSGQMPRLVGLAYASKLYRQNDALKGMTTFSDSGNEVAFGTIGNAATAEGLFFESINAAGVLQIPMITSVWDDGYGISVPNEYQMTKGDISKMLVGMQRTEKEPGYEIFTVRGWDYPTLCETYQEAARICREEHVPVLVHVTEMTQPQGHSTSGSHERYKSKERLAWEAEHDCIKKMREWLVENGLASPHELDVIEKQSKETVRVSRMLAWNAFVLDMKDDHEEALRMLEKISHESNSQAEIVAVREELQRTINPIRSDAIVAVKKVLRIVRAEQIPTRQTLQAWLVKVFKENEERYSSHLVSQSAESTLLVKEIKPIYNEDSPLIDGREVLRACFDAALARDPRVFAIGQDVGKIGDVNQGFAGLQEKYGELRVTDTGIREATIVGQGIGAALRGLRPIAEIQYLDYLMYALQTLSDDLACLQYRTKGGQKAPVIIRTRGHRLEGVWHSGSPMGMILDVLRGIHVLVPRNMTQAAGFYNTLLKSDDPALIVECLNGYRLKEYLPANIGEFCVPIGEPEILRQGSDVTIVTYGAVCKIAMSAAEQLADIGIQCEVIDVQTLLPFDIHHTIVESVKRTNRVLFADEDMPGGASAYMMQQVLEVQQAYRWLDSQPRTLSARDHRPAYTTDGDYFSKPNVEDMFDIIYAMMHEVDAVQFPGLY